MERDRKEQYKSKFRNQLNEFIKELQEYVSTNDGQWTVKGFIDIYIRIFIQFHLILKLSLRFWKFIYSPKY